MFPLWGYISQVPRDVSAVVAELRLAGGDSTAVEVKASAGGLSDSIASTISAFSNMPGGGLIILGLDEKLGFEPVDLPDPDALMKALGSKARAFHPPAQIDIELGTVDGHIVVLGAVKETDASMKPCRAPDGRAYLRSYDGDYPLSQVEEQAFLAQRRQPRFDQQPVAGATERDLDPDLVGLWKRNTDDRAPGLARYELDERLVRAGVLTPDRVPTVAGLLALGSYPQQFFDGFVIRAASAPRPDDPPTTRARNAVTIAGAIPRMLDEALDWARRTLDRIVVSDGQGGVRDAYEYPLDALRELIANTLVHRDLDEWSQGTAIQMRHEVDRFVVTNPGGLYGITVDRLGDNASTSARNARLVALCQNVASPETGTRVIEALATGIPIVRHELEVAHLPEAQFLDQSIRFTVLLHRTPAAPAVPDLTPLEHDTYAALVEGPLTAEEVAAKIERSPQQARKFLRQLRDKDLIRVEGGRGKPTTYHRI